MVIANRSDVAEYCMLGEKKTPVPGRTIAIGDIHGCLDALVAILDAIGPCRADTIVALGDYIDRGPNSSGVIDLLIRLTEQCQLVLLRGNHEEALLDTLQDRDVLRRWLNLGGTDTLRSYGWVPGGAQRALADWFPAPHRDFLANCREYFETPTHLFVHAGYVPELPLSGQPALALRWRVTDPATAAPHSSGKVAVVGHTPQHTGEMLDLGFLVCIDTNCVRGGWLTALDVGSGQVWQANRVGQLRASTIRAPTPTS